MKKLLRGAAIAAAAIGLLATTLPMASASAASGRLPEPANYTLVSRYNGDISSFRGWQIDWQVPVVSNAATSGAAAIGQWYWNLETGIFWTEGSWFVYYFGDTDGTAGDNFTDCEVTWPSSGGVCHSLPAAAGSRVTFTYEYCNASNTFDVNGLYLCAYADLNNGAGRHFLARDVRTNQDGSVSQEMYAHDIESFSDPDTPQEVQIPCSQPTKMLSQKVRWGGGPFQVLQSQNWKLQVATDVNFFYDFQNINLTASTPTWESCSPAPPICTPPNPYWDPSVVYNSPAVVAWNRHRWRAKWYTQGEIPGIGEAWLDLGSC